MCSTRFMEKRRRRRLEISTKSKREGKMTMSMKSILIMRTSCRCRKWKRAMRKITKMRKETGRTKTRKATNRFNNKLRKNLIPSLTRTRRKTSQTYKSLKKWKSTVSYIP